MKPDKVNILGVEYSITYVDNPSEVDIYKRDSLWGQIDYWTRTIRIYDNDRRLEDIFHSLLHEVLHGISSALKLKLRDENMHDELDVIFRNGWIMQKDGNLYGEQKREDIR